VQPWGRRRRSTGTHCWSKYRDRARQAAAARRQRAVRRGGGVFERYAEDPYVERTEREPLVRRGHIRGDRRRVRRPGHRGREAAPRPASTTSASSRRAATSAAPGTGTATPARSATRHSFVYLPLFEETGHMPTEKYAHGPEILEHSRRIARHFGLYDRCPPLTPRCTSVDWDDGISPLDRPHRSRRRAARQVRHDRHRAAAPPEAPRHPRHRDVPRATPSTRAGGTTTTPAATPNGAPLDKLADKRVGIIGTGATAVQCIPHLARAAKELYVFQRTPVVHRHAQQRPDRSGLVRSRVLKPGWQAAVAR
jgi:hypothetical protein